MAFDFPASPTTGQVFTPAGGTTYVYNGNAWDTVSGAFVMSFKTIIGNGTYTPPGNLVQAIVETIAGGGGGGGATGVAGQFRAGGGGGSGGYSRRLLSAAQIGASQPCTIGTGGVGAIAGDNYGTAGLDTSFGSLVVAKGGGAGGAAMLGHGSGGLGGSIGGAVGDIVAAGAPGINGGYNTNGTTVLAAGGGGSSAFGGGGMIQSSGTSTIAWNGVAGSNYGSGGSGGMSYNVAANAAGGRGSDGVIFVTEFIGISAAAVALSQYILKAGDTMTGPLAVAVATCAPVALGHNVAGNFSANQAFTVAMAAAFTVANPSADPAVGTFVSITVDMTAAGALTFGNKFKGVTAGYLQSTWVSGTMRDHLVFRWSGTTYDLVGAARGINQ